MNNPIPIIAMTKDFQFPNFYVRLYPHLPAFPLNWRDEQSGVLPVAIMAYLEDDATDEQIKLVGKYIDYYIHAPVWEKPDGFVEELAALRESSKNLNTRQEIHEWIHQAMNLGLDPL